MTGKRKTKSRISDETLITGSDDVFPFKRHKCRMYEGWNFNSGNYLFTTDTK